MKKYLFLTFAILISGVTTVFAAPTAFYLAPTSTPGCLAVRSSGLVWSNGIDCGSGSGGGSATTTIFTGFSTSTSPFTFSTSTLDTDFTITTDNGHTVTFNLPVASATTTGKLSSVNWNTIFNNLVTSWSAPLHFSAGTASITQSASTSDGYLSSTDWINFNGKQPAGAYLTSVTADTPLSGAGTSASHLVISQANTSTNGYLSSTDWNTFNKAVASTTALNGISPITYTASTGAIGCSTCNTSNASVSSVAMTTPTGLSVSGSPITTSGTLGLTLTSGYVIPLTASTSQWASAYASTTALSGTAPITYNISTGAIGCASCLSTTSASTTYVPYTGATGLVNLGSQGLTTSGTLSATNTLAINATTTNQVISSATTTFLATDGNGKVISTTTPVLYAVAGTFTAAQSFPASGVLIKGSSTGYNTFTMANSTASAYTTTIPANTGTVAELNIAGQTFTANQQITNGVTTNPTLVLKQVASQTADNLQLQDSSANVLSKVDVNGSGFFSGTGQSIIQTGMVVNQSQDNTSNGVFLVNGSTTPLITTDNVNDRVIIATTTGTEKLTVNGNLGLATVGNGIRIKTGTNATVGSSTLSGGTVTVSTTAVQAGSFIFLTDTQAGVVNIGVLTVSAISAGTSFTVTSSNVLDNSTFNYFIINPY